MVTGEIIHADGGVILLVDRCCNISEKLIPLIIFFIFIQCSSDSSNSTSSSDSSNSITEESTNTNSVQVSNSVMIYKMH